MQPYLSVSLQPDGYMRTRFAEGGQSYETKKHGAQRLIIRGAELTQMVEAMSDEIKLCHQLLLDHDLIPKLIEAQNQRVAKCTD